MRKMLIILLCLSVLAVPADAAEENRYVVLTFDDGPSGRFTRRLLDGLEERNVKATFLLCGYRIAEAPELTRRIWEEGHEIGYHGYTHCCMGNMCREKIGRELQDTRALLPEGCRPVFLRPPGGKLNDAVRRAAKDAGLAILNWSVDPKDWAIHDTGAVARAVVENVRDGDVILLHDMSDSSVSAALQIIDQLRQEGFEFVTASELAAMKGIIPEPGRLYCRFPA